MDNQKEEKHITLGFVISWIFGIILGISGIMMIFSKPLIGLLLVIAAGLLLPPINKLIKDKFKISLSTGLRIVIVIIILIIAGIQMSGPKEQQPQGQTPSTQTQTSQSETRQSTNNQATTQTQQEPQTVLDLSGNGSKSTQTFTVGNNWEIKWNYDCSNFGYQGNFMVSVYNSDGTMSYKNAMINKLGNSDSDTDYYHSAGTYYLNVNSMCDWEIQVVNN